MNEKRFIFVGSGIEDNVDNESYLYNKDGFQDVCDLLNDLSDENEQLRKENQRLTNKLNNTALELVDVCISQGKATEISEMTYKEFLEFRAKNNKPMELQL